MVSAPLGRHDERLRLSESNSRSVRLPKFIRDDQEPMLSEYVDLRW